MGIVRLWESETGRLPRANAWVETRSTDQIRNVGPDSYCDAYLNVETARLRYPIEWSNGEMVVILSVSMGA